MGSTSAANRKNVNITSVSSEFFYKFNSSSIIRSKKKISNTQHDANNAEIYASNIVEFPSSIDFLSIFIKS